VEADAEALERQADTVRELELQLEEQVRLQVEAETETRHSIVMTEVGAELSQADAEQPENPQVSDHICEPGFVTVSL
jgi:hypothetical protein